LNKDSFIDLEDWELMKAGFVADLTGLSTSARFELGDLDRSGFIDLYDMNLFRNAYEQAHGAGAFDSLVSSVPAPAGLTMAGILVGIVGTVRRTRRG